MEVREKQIQGFYIIIQQKFLLISPNTGSFLK